MLISNQLIVGTGPYTKVLPFIFGIQLILFKFVAKVALLIVVKGFYI